MRTSEAPKLGVGLAVASTQEAILKFFFELFGQKGLVFASGFKLLQPELPKLFFLPIDKFKAIELFSPGLGFFERHARLETKSPPPISWDVPFFTWASANQDSSRRPSCTR